MSLQFHSIVTSIPLPLLRRLVAACDRFESTWRVGATGHIEQFLTDTPAADRAVAFVKLLELELELRTRAGDTPRPADYYPRFPDHRAAIDAAFTSAASAPVPPPPRGAIGGYDLLEVLGRGGMGVVYKARQRAADRTVALKLIRPELLFGSGAPSDAEFVRRFRDEARAAASLRHDNIVPVYEVGEEDGTHFFSMPQLGGTLADAVRDGPLGDRRAAETLAQVARGVQHAHEAGIVHRDLKPRNVLLDESGRPLVTDFGLARGADSMRTATGGLVGTPAYAAPEQARGDPATPATDVYGLGATLYELLTGRPPFLGPDPVTTLRRVLDEEPIPPRRLNPAVSRDLETVCLQCLAKDPARRYPTAAALADDLERFLSGRPVVARRVSSVERAWKWARRRPAAATLVALLLAAVPVGVGAVVLVERQVETARVDGLVKSLETAETADLPRILRDLEEAGARAAPRLRRLFAESPDGSREKARAAIALLRVAGEESDYVLGRALEADPAEVRVIRDALRGRPVPDHLWAVRTDPSAPSSKRLRAACLLAAAAPNDARWGAVAPTLADELATESPVVAAAWAELLRPVAARLDGPLRRTFADRLRPEWGQAAAVVLAEFHRDDAAALVGLLADATPPQFTALAGPLRRHPRAASAVAEGAKAVRAEPSGSESAPDRRLERNANLALAFVRLGDHAAASDLLADSSGGDVYYPFVARLAGSGVRAEDLFRLLGESTDPRFRRAVLLGIGEVPLAQVLGETGPERSGRVVALYRDDPDPGVHSAAEWTLRKWGRAGRTPALEPRAWPPDSRPSPGWTVTRSGLTMATFHRPGGRVNPRDPALVRHEPANDFGPFAISLKEVTAGEFGTSPAGRGHSLQFPAGNPDHPAVEVAAYAAAEHCLWLDRREGLDERESCYLSDGGGGWGTGYRLKPEYRTLRGHRLPTEAEWEYACENSAPIKAYLARNEDVLGEYSWYRETARNQLHPVGSLKPNRYGLFDWHGNAAEWCEDRYLDGEKLRQVYHGLSAETSVAHLAALRRGSGPPGHRDTGAGFRVARSLPHEK